MIQLFQGEGTFVIGLGITQIVDVIASELVKEVEGNAVIIVRMMALGVDVVIVVVFVLFGCREDARPWRLLLAWSCTSLTG